MADATYKVIELVGTSGNNVAEAIQNAVLRASQTVRGMDWFEVTRIRGRIQDQRVGEFQVEMKVGFRVMEHDELPN